MIDASIGNFDTKIFETFEEPSKKIFGEIYIISMVVCFNILLMNLIIAVLANTYETFDSKSNGLYLSKILQTRDELNYDLSYGAILSAAPPINAIQIPFVPVMLVLRYNSDLLVKINEGVMMI